MDFLAKISTGADRHNKTRIIDLCRPIPGARLLDLGCADGSFTIELARRVEAAELHAVEFVEPLAAAASQRGIEVRRSDLNEPFPYDAESFDVVHANQVIEHLVKTDSFVAEIRRVLKPSGYAILSTNNLAAWHNIFSLVLGMQPMPCHVSDDVVIGNTFDPRHGSEHDERGFTHLRVFSFRALGELLEFHGFTVDELVTSGYYPFPPSVADRLCRIDPRHGAFLIARARPNSSPTRRFAPST